jgi:hypothetical protein
MLVEKIFSNTGKKLNIFQKNKKKELVKPISM